MVRSICRHRSHAYAISPPNPRSIVEVTQLPCQLPGPGHDFWITRSKKAKITLDLCLWNFVNNTHCRSVNRQRRVFATQTCLRSDAKLPRKQRGCAHTQVSSAGNRGFIVIRRSRIREQNLARFDDVSKSAGCRRDWRKCPFFDENVDEETPVSFFNSPKIAGEPPNGVVSMEPNR